MQIEVRFTREPDVDTLLTVEKLFQVIFLEPAEKNGQVTVYTTVVLSRADGEPSWPGLAMETQVTLRHRQRENTVTPITTEKTKDFFKTDIQTKMWWGRDTAQIHKDEEIDSAIDLINSSRQLSLIKDDDRAVLRRIQKACAKAQLPTYVINEPLSRKSVFPFLLFCGEAGIRDGKIEGGKRHSVLFKTNPSHISQELSELCKKPATCCVGIGSWVKQEFNIWKHKRSIESVEFSLYWPEHLACRDVSLYFVIGTTYNIEEKSFRFIADKTDDYRLDILEKLPPQNPQHFKEWKRLGIVDSKLLRFPSSKLDLHFNNGTAKKLEIRSAFVTFMRAAARTYIWLSLTCGLQHCSSLGSIPVGTKTSRPFIHTIFWAMSLLFTQCSGGS